MHWLFGQGDVWQNPQQAAAGKRVLQQYLGLHNDASASLGSAAQGQPIVADKRRLLLHQLQCLQMGVLLRV